MFWEALPQYMAVGMTPQEFWDGDPALCKAYREAWMARQSISNAEQWRMGAYVYNAVGAAVASCLDKDAHEYLKEPFPLEGEEKGEEEPTVPAGVAYLQEYTARRKAARRRREKEGEDG